ncbi:MAG: AI-2E family transporter [Lachnospiraceae bacterium]|nr:AI-2E family transporter [Lachnospiraceae bacterium]
MKLNINRKYIKIGFVAFLVIVFSLIFAHFLNQFDSIPKIFSKIIGVLQPIIFGIIFAYLFNPIVNFFERELVFPIVVKKHGRISEKCRKVTRVFAVIFTFLVIGLLIYGLISLVSPKLTESIGILINQLPNYIYSLEQMVNKYSEFIEAKYNQYVTPFNSVMTMFDMSPEKMGNWLSEVLPETRDWLTNLSGGLKSMLVSLWNVVIGLIVSIYVLFTKEKFAAQAKKILYALFNTEKANNILKDTRFVSDTFIGFISGKIFDSIIIGILCFIGLTIIKIPYTVLISVIIGITNIIPFFGPFIGAIPAAFLLLMINPFLCLRFIIFIVILQQIDGNIIGPKILGDSTGLSGFWVIFAITVFGGLWNVIGMFIGIPFFAVIYALVKRKIETKLADKDMPTETEYYAPVKRIDENGEVVALAEADDSFYLRENDVSFDKIKENAASLKEKASSIVKRKCKSEDKTSTEDDTTEKKQEE